MSTVNQKYIKDENGEIVSPITSSDSVYYPSSGLSMGCMAMCKFYNLNSSIAIEESGTTYFIGNWMNQQGCNEDVLDWSTSDGYIQLKKDCNMVFIYGQVYLTSINSHVGLEVVTRADETSSWGMWHRVQFSGKGASVAYQTLPIFLCVPGGDSRLLGGRMFALRVYTNTSGATTTIDSSSLTNFTVVCF